MSNLVILLLLWALISHFERSLGSGDGSYCYYEENDCFSQWKGEKCQTGKSQSPIDIEDNYDYFKNFKIAELEQSPEYYEMVDFELENNGHTVQVTPKPNPGKTFKLTGSLLKKKNYNFAQLHFHWGSTNVTGSEHTVGGRSYPMEVHLVHYSDEYTDIGAAVKSEKPDALAVFGIFYKISNQPNNALVPIIELFKPDIQQKETSAVGKSLIVHDFFPPVNEGNALPILQYNGSLTTPKCQEIVLWNVFPIPVPISAEQLLAFRQINNKRGRLVNNYRPVQDLNDRRVQAVITLMKSSNEIQGMA